MPPSPAMRVSPGRELRVENHKRGRSLESGILYREKDDDLALFNEVRNKEKEDFLLQSNDNFDDIFSTKLRYLSDYKLGISIPARGESSDLLNTEGDKNDYDWLITPPETPLFASLDDDTLPISLAPRGRSRSQPVSISQSSAMEKGYRNSRGSASPQRFSPSPRSGNSTLQSRSRPFPATHSSPPPTLRHSSPSRRLSPPPSKPIPAPRSSTPIPRRMSTGSASATAPSRVKGASPIKTNRGNSASPKIRAWQSNIPGFSSEAPPNLRTSLADRPASYVRGSSPASRNGSRSGRQSMSPTASRSVSSSHSHDRDLFSAHSKGSVASSGDDDTDSPQSLPVSFSDRSAPRSVGTLSNNRAMGFSKKPTKILSSSAPKRSFDLALRQMDKKGPQNMFRPLLSSVPSSTFASAHHRSLTSRNSSITTSSNASSDQGTSGAHYTEEIELNQEDVTGDGVKGQYPNVHDEIFAMDQADALDEDVENRILEESPVSQHGEIDDPSIVSTQFGVADRSSQLDTATAIAVAVVLDREYDCSNADGTPDMAICSKCGHRFQSGEVVMEGDLQLCVECKMLEVNTTIENGSLEVVDQSTSIPEPLQVTCSGKPGTDYLDKIANGGQDSYSEPSQAPAVPLVEEGVLTFVPEQVINQQLYGDSGHEQLQHGGVNLNSKVDASEGAGISLLLKKSSSCKGPIVQSRSFTASNICYDDFSYVRDTMNSIRSSIGHSSASVSSSVDLGYSRKTETRIHRQSSGQKSDVENYMCEMPTKHKRSVSSLSGASSLGFQVRSVTPSCHEDSFEVIVANMDKVVGEATCVDPCEQSLLSECAEVASTCTDVESNIIFKTAAELSSHLINAHSGDISVVSGLTSEEPVSHENSDYLTNNSSNAMNADTLSVLSQTFAQGEDVMPSSCAGGVDVAEVPNPNSLDFKSEMEIENADIVSAYSHSDFDSTNSCTNELLEPSDLVSHNDVRTATLEEFNISDPAHGVLEESTVMLEDLGRTKSRSLTLEEATDAILFCSSIVHNLAYEAANIALDKETSPVEVLQPALTFVGKSNSERWDIRSRTTGKRGLKSQEARQKKLETDIKPPSINAENDEKSSPRVVKSPYKSDSMKPPKLESKCNCTIM